MVHGSLINQNETSGAIKTLLNIDESRTLLGCRTCGSAVAQGLKMHELFRVWSSPGSGSAELSITYPVF